MFTELWIARKLNLSRSTAGRYSPGVVIAVCGVALALMIMQLTLAVVTGFKSEIMRKIMGFDSQIAIGAPYDYSSGAMVDYVTLTPALQTIVDDFADGHNASLVMQQPGVLKTDDNFAGVVFVGYDNNHDASFEKSNIIDGCVPDFEQQDADNMIVVSSMMAESLGVGVGDRLYSYFFVGDALKMRRHTIAGVYCSNMNDYDKTIVYASLRGLQSVADVDSLTGTKIEFEGYALDDIAPAVSDLTQSLYSAVQTGTIDRLYPVTSVLQTGAVFINWLALLDMNVVVIFILMLCVAGFTLVSSLFFVVLDHIPTVGMLRAIGASRRSITAIFLTLGMKLVAVGLVIGNVVGLGLCYMQSTYKILPLDPNSYYISYVPIEVNPWAMVLLNVGVLVVSFAVLYIPALSSSRIDPTSTMRYE